MVLRVDVGSHFAEYTWRVLPFSSLLDLSYRKFFEFA
jgi:hypothetical protein